MMKTNGMSDLVKNDSGCAASIVYIDNLTPSYETNVGVTSEEKKMVNDVVVKHLQS